MKKNLFSSFIWYEKYRQKNLDKLSLNKHTKRKMEEFIENKEIPHLLFTGPPGSGKTTLAMILIDHCASAKLELNGSSKDRGIDVIKNKVNDFASSLRRDSKRKNIVFFDEADGLTRDAQRALKNLIEKKESNCRFIFTANNLNLIDEAIQSRCLLFKFDSVPKEDVFKYCKYILEKEKIDWERKQLDFIIDRFYPDIRSIINNIQNSCIQGTLNIKNLIKDNFNWIEISKLIKSGDIGKIRKLWAGTTYFDNLWKYLINDFIIDINQDIQGDIGIVIAEYMYRDGSVIDREINSVGCLLEIMQIINVKNIRF